MILTTTPTIHGRENAKVCGIVSAQVAYGMNIFKDIAAAWRDVVGGRANALQNTVADSYAAVMRELGNRASELYGADAVVGISTNLTEFSSGNGMVIITATGTAVKWTVSAATEEAPSDPGEVIRAALHAWGDKAPASLLKLNDDLQRAEREQSMAAVRSMLLKPVQQKLTVLNDATHSFSSGWSKSLNWQKEHFGTARELIERIVKAPVLSDVELLLDNLKSISTDDHTASTLASIRDAANEVRKVLAETVEPYSDLLAA